MSVYLTSIPEELRRYRQWVCWRWNDGKKEPVHPVSGRLTSVVDPSDWSNYETAVASLEEKTYAGLGFVFSKDDPYVGIDLDGCIDQETGEVAPWAYDIVRRIDSYTEISPSGTGLHIIAKGRLPGPSRRTKAIEVYEYGRFFTVTGRVFYA